MANKNQLTRLAMQLTRFAFLLLFFLCCPLEAIARGGGGGSSGGGGIVTLILLPFFLIYSAFVTHLVMKKNKETSELSRKLENLDAMWNMDNIKSQVEAAYFKMQDAWMKRDQSICRDYVTDKLFAKHQAKTDAMIAEHRQNIMEDINLIDSRLVQISDFKDNNKDSFWVYIKGSMVDYIIDDRDGRVVKGDKKNRVFSELWKFSRVNNRWLLDEIKQSVGLSDLGDFHNVTEESLNESPRFEMQAR
jgi:Uncharacterized protein conserved in bacteria